MNKTNFSAIVTGMFFLMVIASEFFVNYKIMLKHKEKKEELSFSPSPAATETKTEEEKEGK